IVMVALVATCGVAHANLVLESHDGLRHPQADRLLAPFLDELDDHGFTARRASVAKYLGGRLPRAAASSELTISEFARACDHALAVWRRQPKDNRELLAPLVRAAKMGFQNPGFL